jgi:IMP dehydrogenase
MLPEQERLQEALTFDDVLLLPGYSEVVATDVSLASRLTREINLNIPLVSAAMDTVTEARLAIAMAQEGGIGIIHKSMGVAEQAAEVRRVKKYEAGVVKDPITIQHLRRARTEGGHLAGIVTGRDLRFETRMDKPGLGHHDAARASW